MNLSTIPTRVIMVFFLMATSRLMADPTSPTSGSGGLSTNSPQSPAIKFKDEVHNFGQISRGGMVNYDFIFTNAGQASLIISNAESSCGCTSVGKWTASVAPGKTGIIPIVLNSVDVSGIVNISIHIASNDPQHPEFFLKLEGKIADVIYANPMYALFDLNRDFGPDAVNTLVITNTTTQPVTLSSPTIINTTNFTAEIKTIVPGWDYHLLVHLTSRPATNQQGIITVKTSSKDQPQIVISVIAVIPSGNVPVR